MLLVGKLYHLSFIRLPVKDLWLLLDRHYMEYVIYHAFSIQFGLLGDVLFIQLHYS